MEESRNLGHNYVGTEHILLGLMREQEGVAAQVLMNCGLRLDRVRDPRSWSLLSREPLSLFEPSEPLPGRRNQEDRLLRRPPCVRSAANRTSFVSSGAGATYRARTRRMSARAKRSSALGTARKGSLVGLPRLCRPRGLRFIAWQCRWGNGNCAKEEAVVSGKFEKAVWYHDQERELDQRLSALVEELLKDQ